MSIIARLFVVIAIIAGVFSFILSKQVDEKARGFKEGWDNTKQTLKKTEDDLKKTAADLSAKQKDFETLTEEKKKTEGQLAEATANLTTLKAQLDETKKLADAGQAAIKDLEGARAKMAEAEQKCKDLDGQIKVKADEAVKMGEQIVALQNANKSLTETNKQLESKRRFAAGEKDWEMPLPADFTAKVLFYDKSWNFVVLDAGKKKKAIENGVVLLHRGTEVVGAVRISTVDDDASIGDFMGDFKKSPPQAGDTAIPKK